VRSLAEVARRESVTRRYIERLARLAFVAPAIVEAIYQQTVWRAATDDDEHYVYAIAL